MFTNTQIFSSPLSGDTQTVSLPGARWTSGLSFTNMTPNVARELMSFMVRLKGPAGRFYLYDHSLTTPRGSANTVGAYAVIDGALQKGNTINTKGWVSNQSNLLSPGDYIQIKDELKMVVETAFSSGAGVSTIKFDPPIRNSPVDLSNIILEKPMCIMRLVDDEQAGWNTVESILLSGIAFNCIEVFFNG